VSRRAPVSGVSDPGRDVPGAEGARLDALDAAIATLGEEERRLSRLGLELALRRCREERRYWEFLRAVMTLPPHGRGPGRMAA
jgi:hypothetical protein